MSVFFACLFAAVALLGLAYWRWARRVRAEIAEGADAAWTRYREHEPDFLGRLDREAFEAAYARAQFPRFPKYALAALGGFVLALPLVFAVLSGVLWGMDQAGLAAEPAELAKYVPLGEGRTAEGEAQRQEMALYLAKDYAGFYYFFGVIAAWMAVVATAMRLYHGRRPGDLREELIRAREAAEDASRE